MTGPRSLLRARRPHPRGSLPQRRHRQVKVTNRSERRVTVEQVGFSSSEEERPSSYNIDDSVRVAVEPHDAEPIELEWPSPFFPEGPIYVAWVELTTGELFHSPRVSYV